MRRTAGDNRYVCTVTATHVFLPFQFAFCIRAESARHCTRKSIVASGKIPENRGGKRSRPHLARVAYPLRSRLNLITDQNSVVDSMLLSVSFSLFLSFWHFSRTRISSFASISLAGSSLSTASARLSPTARSCRSPTEFLFRAPEFYTQ